MADQPSRITEQDVRDAVARATAAMRAGKIEDARRISAAGIEAGMEDPFLYKVEGLWLQNKGEHSEALRAFHHARELDPDDPMILVGIAGTLSSLNALDSALRIAQTAVEMAPDHVPANYTYAWILEAMHDYPAAKTAYERTLSLRPGHVQALAGLATLGVRLQNYPLALSIAAQALALSPGQPTASIAMAMARIATGDPAKAETAMQDLLARALPRNAQVVATGVLGDALDAQDRIDEAFAAYTRENRLLADQATSQVSAAAAVNGLADALGTTSGRWSSPPSEGASPARGHVFLLGFMRSGTTLLERALARHHDIATLEEIDLLAEPFMTYLAPDPARLLGASDAELEEARAAYWTKVAERGVAVDGKILLDKQPLHTNKLPLIARLFPHAKILFAVRDPRDVIFSCFRRHFAGSPLTAQFNSLEDAARLYDATMRIGAWSKANLPLSFHDVRHESLVADFEPELRAVCDFAGLDWMPEMASLEPVPSVRSLSMVSGPQLAQGLSAEGVGRWRAYAAHLAPFLPIIEPWVRAFGYEG